MRIFYVNCQSFSNLSKYDDKAIRMFKALGVFITYFSSELREEPINSDRAIEERQIFRYSKFKGVAKVFSYSSSQFNILIEALKLKPNIIVFQWLKLPLLDFFILVIMKILNMKVCLYIHNVFPHRSNLVSRVLTILCYRFAHILVCHDEQTRRFLISKLRLNAKKIAVVRHGLIPFRKEFGGAHLASDQRKSLEDAFVFTFVGSGTFYKGLDLLLDSWSTQKRHICSQSVKLVVIGKIDSTLFSKYSSVIESDPTIICLNRHVSENELIETSELTDCFVLPHRRISQSGVLFSIVGLGKPLVCSARRSFIELSRTFSNILICGNSIDSLTAGMRTVFEDPARFKVRSSQTMLVAQLYDQLLMSDYSNLVKLFREAV